MGRASANAALISNLLYTGNTYLGTLNPVTNDSAFFNHDLPAGAFTNTWFFDLNPSGHATVNGNFIPGFPNANSITGFTITLYQVTASCGVIGSSCTDVTLGTQVQNWRRGPFLQQHRLDEPGLLAGMPSRSRAPWSSRTLCTAVS